jgi:hypothetical protein
LGQNSSLHNEKSPLGAGCKSTVSAQPVDTAELAENRQWKLSRSIVHPEPVHRLLWELYNSRVSTRSQTESQRATYVVGNGEPAPELGRQFVHIVARGLFGLGAIGVVLLLMLCQIVPGRVSLYNCPGTYTDGNTSAPGAMSRSRTLLRFLTMGVPVSPPHMQCPISSIKGVLRSCKHQVAPWVLASECLFRRVFCHIVSLCSLYSASLYGSCASSYGTCPYSASLYGSCSYSASPYGSCPYSASPYSSCPYSASPYGSCPYSASSRKRPACKEAEDSLLSLWRLLLYWRPLATHSHQHGIDSLWCSSAHCTFRTRTALSSSIPSRPPRSSFPSHALPARP